MVRFRTSLPVVLGALAIASVGAQAHAQSRGPAPTRAQRPADNAALAQRRGLTLNQSGRWGLNLDTQQPIGREANLGDVNAGAYFRLTPSLRVGGSVGLGERRLDPARPTPEQRSQPRVRLETIFRF